MRGVRQPFTGAARVAFHIDEALFLMPEKILTGMTRDGTFLVEDGKVRHGLLNFRFNESLIHMLSNVEEMSTPVRASGEESFDMVVPAMKVRDFNFTEVTKF